MGDDFSQAISEHLEAVEATRSLESAAASVVSAVIAAYERGGRVYTFGNGGSAADSLHFAEELVARFKRERRPLAAQSLAADPTVLTCIANDYEFDDLFARQVRAFARAGDVVVGFTTSGRSPNVVRGPGGGARGGRDDGPLRRRRRRAGVHPRRRGARRAVVLDRARAGDARAPPPRDPRAGRPLGGRRVSARVLHMIGNAHIDPVWLWQWPEGYQEVRATFRSAVDRLDEFPEFVFTMDSSLFLAWVEESDAELFERIRARVADGRFQVVGGWWIEPDCNIPGGESFVRQALYGQRYLHDRFGIIATTGANLDSFGHNATIPQILAKSGCDSYVFLRPGPPEKALESPVFWWESPDGSRVLAYRIPHEYCAPKDDIGEHVEKSIATLPDLERDYAVFYGVGDHGGGPTIANLEQIETLDARDDLPSLRPSSLRAFFDGLDGANGSFPTVRGELQHHGRGCYTTHSGVKRWNRRAEHLIQRAEKWSSIAHVLGVQPYPRAELTDAWKLLLFNQFHDTLAGTSIEPAYEDARDQIGHASSAASLAFNRAVQSIARQIHIEQEVEMRPVVVFNPHPWPLRADAEIEYTWTREQGHHVVDDEGEAVPMQLTRPLTTMSGMRSRFAFPVDLPPLGYRVYRVRLGRVEGEALACSATRLENDQLLLEVDPVDGPHLAAGREGDRRRPRRARARGTQSSSTTPPTRGATGSSATTASSPSSSAYRRGFSSAARCARSSASRAATARRRCARTTSSAPTRCTSTSASPSTGTSSSSC